MMKRFTRYARSRWICLPTWTKVLLAISIVISIALTIEAPPLWWSLVDSILITVLVAEVNYLSLRERFNAPAVEFAEILAPVIADNDEIIIYKAGGEVKFIGITNEEEGKTSAPRR
ncbi:hypothetical protein ACEN2A_01795 [Corynebacterium auriscanis]|uniref:hypothetical protein n=1 Tax=Corynebacterium auriscanis TaxID=99807 RepID=UPI003CEABF26